MKIVFPALVVLLIMSCANDPELERFVANDYRDYESFVAEYENSVTVHPGSSFRRWFRGNQDLQGHYDQWMEAAEKGIAGGQFLAGECAYWGCGTPKDYAQAAEWYRKAAGQGHAAAQNNLGRAYHNGEGLDKDHA